MQIFRRILSVIALLCTLAACSNAGSAYPYPDPGAFQYIGRDYILTMLYEDPVLPENAPHIMFNGSELNGKGYCNLYSGPYTGDGTVLKPGTIAKTEMACADPTLMFLDTRYFTALSEVASMHLDGTKLSLSNADGTVVLIYAEG